MYCPNCGKQIEDNARFCGECGTEIEGFEVEETEETSEVEETSLEEEDTAEEVSEETDAEEEIVEEVYEEDEEEEKKKKKTPKKKYSRSEKKKIKIIAAESILFVCLLAAYIMIGSAYSTPDKVMKKYAKARQDGNWEQIYDLYDTEGSGFITKEQFVTFMEKEQTDNGLVANYTVRPTSINNGITQSMVMTYSTTTGRSGAQEYFTAKRAASNRFFFFQKWKLDGGDIFKKNLYIKYVPGVTMELDGVEIKKDYLTTYTSGDLKIQAYKIPAVLKGEHSLRFKDDDDFIEKTEQSISVYEADQYCVPTVKYTQAAAKKAIAAAKTYVKEIYDAAYSKKGVSAIKKYFSSTDEAQKAYDEIIESYRYYTQNDYSMRSYSIRVNSAEANTNAEEAGLRVMVYGDVKIDYQYRGIYSGSIYQYNTNKGIYQSMVIGYEDGEWKIASFGY